MRSRRALVDDVVSRGDLVKELADDLDEGAYPQVLVGPSGSGKTMTLLKLAQHLAKRGQVPVPVSLRKASDVDFDRMARGVYRERLPRRTDEEADKHWRWLRRGQWIVVIADDLEKAEVEPNAVARGLDAAARQRLAVVAACRPEGIPAELKRGRVDLERLDERDVCRDLTKRLEARQHTERNGIDAASIAAGVVTAADIPSVPYYLAIARVLANTGKLSDVAGQSGSAARLALLEAYRETLTNGQMQLDAGLSVDTRRRVFAGLEAVAFVIVRSSRPKQAGELAAEVDHVEQLRPGTESKLAASTVIEYAERLGVLDTRHDGAVHFGHPTTLSYFASCFLIAHRYEHAAWEDLLRAKSLSPTASLALVLANAGARDPELAAQTCARLLERQELRGRTGRETSRSAGAQQRLALLRTATTIASDAPGHNADTEAAIADCARREEGAAAPVLEQVRLVKELAGIGSRHTYDVLWDYASAPREYLVRREAVKAIIDAGPDFLDRAKEKIDRIIGQGEAHHRSHGTGTDDQGEPFDSLRVAAWVLPSLRSRGGDGRVEEDLERCQMRLWRLSQQLTRQRGLEASIANGLKLDAVRNPGRPPDELALRMLRRGKGRARFWYSRVLLVQAVARSCIGSRGTEGARKAIREAMEDKHPYVQETARLCTRALHSREWTKYLCDDMTELVAGRRQHLATITSQLIGDIVIALNLNEGADHPRRRVVFGEAKELPPCLRSSRHRGEIVGWESPPGKDCPFWERDGCLCPYRYDLSNHGAWRELSRAFCRRQRIHAQRLPWHESIRVKELQEFWREMESRARF